MRDHRNIRNESRMLPSFCENLQGLSDDAAAKKHFPIKMKHFPINTRNKNEKDNIFQCFRSFQSFRYSRSFRAFEWQSWESRFGNAAKKIIVSLPSSLSSKLHENICIFRCFVFFLYVCSSRVSFAYCCTTERFFEQFQRVSPIFPVLVSPM